MGNIRQMPDSQVFQREMISVGRAQDSFLKGCQIFLVLSNQRHMLKKSSLPRCSGRIIQQSRIDSRCVTSNLIFPRALTTNSSKCVFNPQINIYFDFYPETLAAELATKPYMGESQIWFLLNEISRGLESLHSKSTAHWDIRPATIFKDQHENYRIYASDYFLREPADSLIQFLNGKLGQKSPYISAQVLSKLRHGNPVTIRDGQAMDVFCLGLVLLKIMTKKQIKECYKRGALNAEKIQTMVSGCIEVFSERLMQLVYPMLELADEQRITVKEIRSLLKPLQEDILRGSTSFYQSKDLELGDKLKQVPTQTTLSTQRFFSPRQSKKISVSQLKKQQFSPRGTYKNVPTVTNIHVIDHFNQPTETIQQANRQQSPQQYRSLFQKPSLYINQT